MQRKADVKFFYFKKNYTKSPNLPLKIFHCIFNKDEKNLEKEDKVCYIEIGELCMSMIFGVYKEYN